MMQKNIFFAGLAIFSFLGYLQADWVQQHSGTNNLYCIDFPPNNVTTGYACGANSFILRTTDGGINWDSLQHREPSGNFNAINFPVDEMTGFIACDSGNIQKTTDGGDRWRKISTGTPENLNGIHFPNNLEIGYVVGMGGLVKKTGDGGEAWDDVSLRSRTNLYDVYFLTAETGFAVGDSGTIAYTTDRGGNWQILTSNVTTRLLGIYFRDENNGWVVGAAKTFLKTSDGGQNWEPINVPLPSNTDLYSVIFPVDSNTGFVCGTFGRIAKTTDGGNSWQTTTNLLYHLYRIEFPQDDQIGWVCGLSEAIYKTIDAGWIEEENSGRGAGENYFNCEPNPFRSTTVIRVPLSVCRYSPAKINFYDISGRVVRTFTLATDSGQRTAVNGIVWDGRNELNQRVKSGVYLLEASINGIPCQRLKLAVVD
jgi:photosystem II stability/assembly factor-like uncharacterized protein